MIDEKKLLEGLLKKTFTAEVYNDDFDGVTIGSLLCFGDVLAEVQEQVEVDTVFLIPEL